MSAEHEPNEKGIECSCGAGNDFTADRCWLCGQSLLASTRVEPQSPSSHTTFRLNSLMLTITLIAVCLGVFQISLGIGFLLVTLVTPAFLRTVVAATRGRSAGQPLTTDDKLVMFAASFGLVVAISIASGVAFYATCWAGLFVGMTASEAAGARGYDPLGYGLVAGLIVGIGVGLVVACLLFLRFFRLRNRAEI